MNWPAVLPFIASITRLHGADRLVDHLRTLFGERGDPWTLTRLALAPTATDVSLAEVLPQALRRAGEFQHDTAAGAGIAPYCADPDWLGATELRIWTTLAKRLVLGGLLMDAPQRARHEPIGEVGARFQGLAVGLAASSCHAARLPDGHCVISAGGPDLREGQLATIDAYIESEPYPDVGRPMTSVTRAQRPSLSMWTVPSADQKIREAIEEAVRSR